MRRFGGQVNQFFRVFQQIEQLGPHADVVAVLPGPVAQHEATRCRADRMVFTDDRARGHGPIRQVHERLATGRGQTDGTGRPEDGYRAIDVAYRLGDRLPLADTRAGNDHGHARRLFIEHGLAPQTASAEVVTMVAGIDDQRVVSQARPLEFAQHLANVFVHERNQSTVAGDGTADIVW